MKLSKADMDVAWVEFGECPFERPHEWPFTWRIVSDNLELGLDGGPITSRLMAAIWAARRLEGRT